jgi:plasmid stabilization system protein ParE
VALRVVPTVLAARQIRDEARWWKANRTKAPLLFRDELRRAFRLIANYPEAGVVAADVELHEIRRVLLATTQHFVYYRVNAAAQRIEVVAVWSTSRGPVPLT